MKRNLSKFDRENLYNIIATAKIYAKLASILKSRSYLNACKLCISNYWSYKAECEKFNTDVIEYDFKTNDNTLKAA